MVPKPFSLDIVLKIRKRKEDLAQQKLMRALSEQAQIEKAIDTVRKKQRALIKLLEIKQQQGMFASELALFEHKNDFSNSAIESLKKQLQEKKQIVENKRNQLIAKSRNHKVLQALKDNQNQEWKQYLDKKEASMLDEIAILHHNSQTL